MGKIKQYNGHHCWNCWNVSLWIGNDEWLYNLAMEILEDVKRGKNTMHRATNRMIGNLPSKTPDGAKYTFKAVRSALIGLIE